MSIERLSALEKDLREEERQQLAESRRHASEGNDETVQAFCNGKAFGLNSAAQRIANIIAELGQEVGAVAPVSFAVELADGTLGALGWIDYAKFEHVKNMGTLANGARYVFAYRTAPAHTSEARDAARYRWLRENVRWEPMPRDTSGAVYLVATMVSAVYGNCNDQTDEAIDAAMRQEAGSRD